MSQICCDATACRSTRGAKTRRDFNITIDQGLWTEGLRLTGALLISVNIRESEAKLHGQGRRFPHANLKKRAGGPFDDLVQVETLFQ